ncbi:MAG: MFS transporter [Nocardioides sp.]|nr:MFS transporter [Nocardioides sp.]
MRNPNYRRYVAGTLVSNTGTWMQRIAQDWLVLSLGGGGTALGITTGLQFLPVLLLSPFAGVLADRFPKRRLLQVTQATMGLTALLLGLLAVSDVAQTWHVYLVALVSGVGAAFDGPARQAFVSEMVGPDELGNAVGLNSASFNLARILGPAVAGLMIGALGGGVPATGWVILLNAVSYLAVIGQLQRMDVTLLRSPQLRGRQPGALREGVAYVRGQPRMILVLIIVFFAGTFGMNFQITSALMATEVFDKGAAELGVLGSAMAVGSLTGALLAARRVTVRLRLIVLAAVGFGVAEIIAAGLPSYVTFALFAPLIGLFTLTLLNSANTTLQLASAPELRGRVMALYMTIVMGGTPIGSPVVGLIGEHAGPRWTLVFGGVMVLVGTGLAVLVYARLTGGLSGLVEQVRHPRVGAADLAPVAAPAASPGSPAQERGSAPAAF